MALLNIRKLGILCVALGFVLIFLLRSGGLSLSPKGANQPRQAPGTETAVRTFYFSEKSTHFRFDHMRSGAIRTANGRWNVQDFAYTLFNPNSGEITVNLRMVSDDAKFVFANGQVGTYTKVYHLKPLFGVSENVYICPAFGKPNWPVSSKSNFVGTVEFTGSRPFYCFILHETPVAISRNLIKAYFKAWDPWESDEPAVWDTDLKRFVIQYTNYWHDATHWPVGWSSTLKITNNTNQLMTYTLNHIPYYGGQYDPSTRQVTKYKEQIVHLSLKPHETKSVTLMKLFGWGDKMSSMEGCLLITPSSAAGAESGTNARLLIVPNNSGQLLHPVIP